MSKNYNEQLKQLHEDENSSWNLFEKQTVLISSGLFVLFFIYIPEIFDFQNRILINKTLYLFGIGGLLISIFINVLSQLLSYQYIRYNIKNFYYTEKCKVKCKIKFQNRIIGLLNWLQLILLFTSSCLVFNFIYINLK